MKCGISDFMRTTSHHLNRASILMRFVIEIETGDISVESAYNNRNIKIPRGILRQTGLFPHLS